MSEDEKIQEIARIREKQLHDEATALGNAKREGIAEGIAQGIIEGVNKGKTEERLEIETRERGLRYSEFSYSKETLLCEEIE